MNVERQIVVAEQTPAGRERIPRNVLVIGASTGYGLASRIAAAWGYGARTVGVFFEWPPDGRQDRERRLLQHGRSGSTRQARRPFGRSHKWRCFLRPVQAQRHGNRAARIYPPRPVVYSLASPKRTHPRSGIVHSSVLKPIGQAYSNRTIELDSEKVVGVNLPPASEKEIADTVAVMGGEDWRIWIEALAKEGVLAPGVRTLAYSYIGPQMTWPIYRDETPAARRTTWIRRPGRSMLSSRPSLEGERWSV